MKRTPAALSSPVSRRWLRKMAAASAIAHARCADRRAPDIVLERFQFADAVVREGDAGG